MNELNKLLTTLLLLGAGFFAASLVGPPEVVERLSKYLRPTAPAVEGLRPLAANASPTGADSWAPQNSPAPMAAASSQVAPMAGRIAPASWPNETPELTPPALPSASSPAQSFAPAPAPSASPLSPWGEPAAVANSPAPAADDWLTGASLTKPAARPSAAPEGRLPLTPVPRSDVAAQREAPQESEPVGWPQLRAPLAPGMPATGMPVNATTPSAPDEPTRHEVTVAKPSLDDNPYGTRPSFEAAMSSDHAPWNPLRNGGGPPAFEPVERQPVAATYTKHVVTDGDTLPALAERYLGDAGRAGELFELNRDRLEHPDVLPIGMVLKAPEGASIAHRPAANPSGGFPRLERPGDFATVSATEAYVGPASAASRQPLTPISAADDRPLTRDERLGPVDAVYNNEVAWDANRW